MIQLSHFWVYIQNNWKQDLKEIFVYPLLIAALFTIAKRWKQSKCSLTDKMNEQKDVKYDVKTLNVEEG